MQPWALRGLQTASDASAENATKDCDLGGLVVEALQHGLWYRVGVVLATMFVVRMAVALGSLLGIGGGNRNGGGVGGVGGDPGGAGAKRIRKTLLGKAIAHQFGATLFSVSASSSCSGVVGEEKEIIQTLFEVPCDHQPAVILIDIVDSMLFHWSEETGTEFLNQLEGAGTRTGDRVIVVGTTNRPQDLDEATRSSL
eukprot:g14317.t1